MQIDRIDWQRSFCYDHLVVFEDDGEGKGDNEEFFIDEITCLHSDHFC